MRVLSLSHRLQNRLIDNHTIFNAPNLVDYDAIVFDAGGVFDSVREAAEGRGEFVTHAHVPVANGDSVDGVAGLAELLHRRREELQRALERGAVVAVYGAPVTRFGGIAGLQGFDRYFLLPAPDGMAWDAATIRGGEGSTAAVVDHGHPFVPVYEAYRRQLLYRAYFDDRAPGFARNAHVFLRSGGGAPLGVEFRVFNGRLVFLPMPREVGARWLAPAEGNATVTAIREVLGAVDEDRPRWLRNIGVPGLEARLEAVRGAESELRRAQEALDSARSEAEQLEAVRDILWAGHEQAVRRAAIRCAEILGFTAREDDEGNVVLQDGEHRLHLVTAASNEAVDMAAHYRLRQRIDRLIEQRAKAERGLIVANGQRQSRPQDRKREIAESLRVASEAVGYALLTSRWLYAAAIAALEGLPDETLAEMRRRMAATDGLVAFGDLLVPGSEGAQAAEGAEHAVEDAPPEEAPGDSREATESDQSDERETEAEAAPAEEATRER